jgi:hypothetical protein
VFDEEEVQASEARKLLTLECLGSDPDDKTVDCGKDSVRDVADVKIIGRVARGFCVSPIV